MDRARLERQMHELALEHVAARVDDAEYLGRMAHLRAGLEEPGRVPSMNVVPTDQRITGPTSAI